MFFIKKVEMITFRDHLNDDGSIMWLSRLQLTGELVFTPDDADIFIKIKILYCSNNQLTSIVGLENLPNLELFYCYNNQLTSIIGLENLPNLERFDCNNNRLNMIPEIEHLINLGWLNCQDNQLESLSGIENCLNLHVYNFVNNPLPSYYLHILKKLYIFQKIRAQKVISRLVRTRNKCCISISDIMYNYIDKYMQQQILYYML